MRRGATAIASTSRAKEMIPRPTSAVLSTAKAHSNPTTPMALPASPRAFSAAVWGAWSVAITSIVPSCKPATSASRSARLRSGGFILKRPSSRRSSSHSTR